MEGQAAAGKPLETRERGEVRVNQDRRMQCIQDTQPHSKSPKQIKGILGIAQKQVNSMQM